MFNEYKYEQALRYYSQGQTSAAIDLLKQLLSEDPNDAACHGLLAACLLGKKRIHAAEYELKLALAIDPLEPFLHLVYARVYYYQNKFAKSLGACDEVLSRDPESVEALKLKADILMTSNRGKEALSCLQEVSRLEPDSVETFCALGNHYLRTGEKDLALEYAAQALAKEAQHYDSNVLMGYTQLEHNDLAEAEYHAKLAIMLDPESEGALLLLASIKMRRSWFLGLWWRLNTKLNQLSNLGQATALISAFVLFNFISDLLADFDMEDASNALSYAWLGVVAYSWFAIPAFHRAIKKEIESFSFNKDF